MDEIIILESIETDYEKLKVLVLNAFKKEIINPDYEFEEFYIIIQLKNEQLSLKICNAFTQKHFDNSLLEFVQYLNDEEGIETFIYKSKNKVEIFFSKFVGMEEEDLIDSDKKIIEYERNIKLLSFSEIVLNILCNKNKMFR